MIVLKRGPLHTLKHGNSLFRLYILENALGPAPYGAQTEHPVSMPLKSDPPGSALPLLECGWGEVAADPELHVFHPNGDKSSS